MSENAWCWLRVSKRFLRKDTPLSPCTKLRCGTGLMKDLDEPKVPFLVRYAQNCFDTSNWVLMCTAFLTKKGTLGSSKSFISPVPHLSFVQGEKGVSFLKKRFETLSQHHGPKPE